MPDDTPLPADPRDLASMYKVAYDQAALSLASQEKSLTALQGRAKDLLGFATLATSIASSLGKLNGTTGVTFDTEYWFLLAITFFAVAVSAGIALRPRGGWAFTIDSVGTIATIESHTNPYVDMADVYKHGARTLDKLWTENNDKIEGTLGVAPAVRFIVIALAAETLVVLAATYSSFN